MENKPASLLVVSLEKALNGIPHLGMVDRWSATPERARYNALIAFSGWKDKYASKRRIVTCSIAEKLSYCIGLA